ncbi:MAG: DUF6680 family protein [Pseudomonadota bacterium]
MGIATIIAVLIGPVVAVIVTRIVDDRRADRALKLDLFRTLMRTRKMPIHVDHVGALNLVEIEFVKYPMVINAWKAYLANLGEKLPPSEQREKYEVAIKRRDSLLTKLISEIAVALRVQVEQLDILEGNYIPQGWTDDDWDNRQIRKGLINLLHGRSALLTQVHIPSEAIGPYPPAPSQKKSAPSLASVNG